MAFGKISVATSEEVQDFKKYIGITKARVLCVNPTKKEAKDILNREFEEEPQYVSMTTNRDGKEIKSCRITFYLQLVNDIITDNVIVPMSIFIREEYQMNNDKTKVNVLDIYGQNKWIAVDDAKAHKPLEADQYNPTWGEYRPAFSGEVSLTAFMKEYLGIKLPKVYNSNTGFWEPFTGDLAECICRFSAEEIAAFFKGDFSAIKNAITLVPVEQTVKVMAGVRTNPETGKQYQNICETVFARAASRSVKAFEKEAARLDTPTAKVKYSATALQEYSVAPTSFTAPAESNDDLPFSTSDDDALPW